MLKGTLMILLILSLGVGAAYGGDTQKLFEAKCAKCHGKDGKGSEKMAKMFKLDAAKLSLAGAAVAKATDADLIKVTTQGRKKMPKFGGKLKAEEIADLVKYIRILGGGKP